MEYFCLFVCFYFELRKTDQKELIELTFVFLFFPANGVEIFWGIQLIVR